MSEMTNMNIASVGSAFPKNYYPQAVLSAALKKYWDGRLNNPDVVERMHNHSAIDGRYLALPVDAYYNMSTWGELLTPGSSARWSWANWRFAGG